MDELVNKLTGSTYSVTNHSTNRTEHQLNKQTTDSLTAAQKRQQSN
jgi:hypothetical protein